MYLLDKNNTTIIERELYIVDNLIIKVLIDIDIIKLERIVVNLRNDFIKINVY